LIHAHIYEGMVNEALALGREEMTRGGATPRELAALDNQEAAMALESFEEWRLQGAEKLAANSEVSCCRMAQLYARVGDKDAALKWLAKGLSASDPMVVFLTVEPAYDSLRSDLRFADLVRRSGL
jgi:hypothetical protein